MNRLFYFIFFALLISCAPKIVVTDNVFGNGRMFMSMNGNYSNEQFDSMCIADKLSKNLSDWERLMLKEYETGENITLYSFFKKNVVYRVEKINNDSVKITKREVK